MTGRQWLMLAVVAVGYAVAVWLMLEHIHRRANPHADAPATTRITYSAPVFTDYSEADIAFAKRMMQR